MMVPWEWNKIRILIDIVIYIVNEDDLICIGDSDSEAHKLMDLTEWSALKKIAILNFCDHCDQGKDIYNSHDQVHENKKETWDKAQVEQVVQSWVEKEEGEPGIFSFGLSCIKNPDIDHDLWYWSWFIMIFQFPPCVSFGHAITGSMVYDGWYRPKT